MRIQLLLSLLENMQSFSWCQRSQNSTKETKWLAVAISKQKPDTELKTDDLLMRQVTKRSVLVNPHQKYTYIHTYIHSNLKKYTYMSPKKLLLIILLLRTIAITNYNAEEGCLHEFLTWKVQLIRLLYPPPGVVVCQLHSK